MEGDVPDCVAPVEEAGGAPGHGGQSGSGATSDSGAEVDGTEGQGEADGSAEEGAQPVVCPQDCTGHGWCSSEGVCVCDPGYEGQACEAHVPPPDLSSMVRLDGYYIDSTEVSAAQFEQCVTDGACDFSGSHQAHVCAGSNASHYRCSVGAPDRGGLPANCISAAGAAAYCAFAGKRLCTATEWEAACKGPSNTTYPWGESYYDVQHGECLCNSDGHGGTKCPNHDHGTGTPCAHAELSGAITCPGCVYFHAVQSGECVYHGLHDMVGNVAEWVIDGNQSTLRGGSAGTSDMSASCTATTFGGFGEESNGIRCCWSP